LRRRAAWTITFPEPTMILCTVKLNPLLAIISRGEIELIVAFEAVTAGLHGLQWDQHFGAAHLAHDDALGGACVGCS
jgi:hypothetical protein